MSVVQKKMDVSKKLNKYRNIDVEVIRKDPALISEILRLIQDVQVVLDEDLKNSPEDIETNDELLSVEETAKLFKVTQQAVYKWIKQNKIQYEQKTPFGGYLIPKSQFNLVDKNYVKDSQKLILGDAVEIDVEDPKDVYEVYPENRES
mgnify:CR=1 FL=1